MSKLEDKKNHLKTEVSNLESDIDVRIQDLKSKAVEALSVETWVKQYPLQSVGLSLLAGFLFAYRTNSKIGKVAKDLVIAELKKQAMNQINKKIAEITEKK
ncbi:MAG: hypothetical protein GW823_00055 [Bacteroidetes bacterium]|nr:hypothetical protein [Bacteroidota bacterium]